VYVCVWGGTGFNLEHVYNQKNKHVIKSSVKVSLRFRERSCPQCVCVCVCTCYFLDDHLAEVTGDVGQQVPLGVRDLVHQLLRRRAEAHQTSGTRRFGEQEGAVGGDGDHRETPVVPEGAEPEQVTMRTCLKALFTYIIISFIIISY